MSDVRVLLLTDVVNSAKLSEQLGDSGMATLWVAHDRVTRGLPPQHDGREIDKTGGFLMLFEAHGPIYARPFNGRCGTPMYPLLGRGSVPRRTSLRFLSGPNPRDGLVW
jgi:class 3 adenylate cyclase